MEAYERLLQLRKNYQEKIENEKQAINESTDDLRVKFMNTYRAGLIAGYKILFSDIENLYGYEMDMLEKSLNEQEKAGDEGAWEKFMRR